MSDWFIIWLTTFGVLWFLLIESWRLLRETDQQLRETRDAWRATIEDFYTLRDIHEAYREAAISKIETMEMEREAEGEDWKCG